MFNYTETRKRIARKAYLVKVQTSLGTAVTVTKKKACELLTVLERRAVEPSVSFTEIGNGKELVIIDQLKKSGGA